ncbi:hypothetical protein PV325_012438 [Microctonus aethiopoides]|nr:hypothetical protein PV325_012438 [Microctonus aethiopoides]
MKYNRLLQRKRICAGNGVKNVATVVRSVEQWLPLSGSDRRIRHRQNSQKCLVAEGDEGAEVNGVAEGAEVAEDAEDAEVVKEGV